MERAEAIVRLGYPEIEFFGVFRSASIFRRPSTGTPLKPMRPKPFTWTADPAEIIAAVRRGRRALESIH